MKSQTNSQRKKVGDARETNWRHETVSGEDDTGYACDSGNHADTNQLEITCSEAVNVTPVTHGHLYDCMLDMGYCPNQVRFGGRWYCGRELRK